MKKSLLNYETKNNENKERSKLKKIVKKEEKNNLRTNQVFEEYRRVDLSVTDDPLQCGK